MCCFKRNCEPYRGLEGMYKIYMRDSVPAMRLRWCNNTHKAPPWFYYRCVGDRFSGLTDVLRGGTEKQKSCLRKTGEQWRTMCFGSHDNPEQTPNWCVTHLPAEAPPLYEEIFCSKVPAALAVISDRYIHLQVRLTPETWNIYSRLFAFEHRYAKFAPVIRFKYQKSFTCLQPRRDKTTSCFYQEHRSHQRNGQLWLHLLQLQD